MSRTRAAFYPGPGGGGEPRRFPFIRLASGAPRRVLNRSRCSREGYGLSRQLRRPLLLQSQIPRHMDILMTVAMAPRYDQERPWSWWAAYEASEERPALPCFPILDSPAHRRVLTFFFPLSCRPFSQACVEFSQCVFQAVHPSCIKTMAGGRKEVAGSGGGEVALLQLPGFSSETVRKLVKQEKVKTIKASRLMGGWIGLAPPSAPLPGRLRILATVPTPPALSSPHRSSAPCPPPSGRPSCSPVASSCPGCPISRPCSRSSPRCTCRSQSAAWGPRARYVDTGHSLLLLLLARCSAPDPPSCCLPGAPPQIYEETPIMLVVQAIVTRPAHQRVRARGLDLQGRPFDEEVLRSLDASDLPPVIPFIPYWPENGKKEER